MIFRLLFTRCWLVAALTATATLAIAAQPPVSPHHVTFFTEPNYKGEALTVEAGAVVENLDRMRRSTQQPWTFAISSVKVEGSAKAIVFSGANFSGDRLEIAASIPDLYAEKRGSTAAGWDRSIASVQVTGPREILTPPPVVVAPAPPPRTVYVVPAPVGPPPRPYLDRRGAEAAVQQAYREVLGRPADPEGLRRYRDRLLFDGWDYRQLVQHLQRSGEARGINADEAITRAYRDVLGRDPDPGGLAHYRSKWREGWTQGQIRDDLRRSREGRNNHIHNAITRAYRELLGRDPDPSGYATYERLMRDRGYSERDVRQAIMAGEEYRQRRR